MKLLPAYQVWKEEISWNSQEEFDAIWQQIYNKHKKALDQHLEPSYKISEPNAFLYHLYWLNKMDSSAENNNIISKYIHQFYPKYQNDNNQDIKIFEE